MYQGPIIDSHHHLWDLSLGRHLWLLEDDPALAALGDISYLRKTYLPADYLRDVGDANVVGTVHVEAVWDRRRSPVEETAWLEMMERPRGIASKCIGFAGLAAPGAEAVLEAQAAFPRVAGVRETIRWHPDPAKRWAPSGIVGGAAFRRGVGVLRRFGFVLELLMNPYQAEEVTQLARDFPDVRILVNHCGTPVDRDLAGLERWRAGLALMATCPNIAIKVSNFGAYGANKSLPALRETVMTCISAFGVERALFGTDYPVARRNMSYAAMVSAFSEIVAGFSPDEQRALFYRNACGWYGMKEVVPF